MFQNVLNAEKDITVLEMACQNLLVYVKLAIIASKDLRLQLLNMMFSKDPACLAITVLKVHLYS